MLTHYATLTTDPSHALLGICQFLWIHQAGYSLKEIFSLSLFKASSLQERVSPFWPASPDFPFRWLILVACLRWTITRGELTSTVRFFRGDLAGTSLRMRSGDLGSFPLGPKLAVTSGDIFVCPSVLKTPLVLDLLSLLLAKAALSGVLAKNKEEKLID